MASGARGPIMVLIGVTALGASALAGVGIGNYTVAGTSSFYADNYRATANARLGSAPTAAAFWDSQGVPRATVNGYETTLAPEYAEVAYQR